MRALLITSALIGVATHLLACGGATQPLPAAPAAAAAVSDEPPTLPQSAQDMILAFRQGPEGNCTSIGFIKAVLYSFGALKDNGVFKKFAHNSGDDSLRVTTRGGHDYVITGAELAHARTMAALEPAAGHAPNKDLMEEGAELFAVLGKACAEDCGNGRRFCAPQSGHTCSTFDDALNYMDSGVNWSAPPAASKLAQIIASAMAALPVSNA